MIDLTKLVPVLEGYKEYFPKHCKDELYKWGAVKHFQDHWDIEADNFGEMFKEATAKTYNLLASGYAYPRAMILEFANADDEATRAMFRALYDEKRDLAERVDEFIAASENMRQKYGAESWRSHYQGINPVSTYLWLRYPDKYYVYKYEVFRAVAKELASDYAPRRTGSTDNIIHGFRMYDEICEAVKADPSIRDMIEKELTPGCYPDPELKTATMDIGFYLTRFYVNEKKKNDTGSEEEWWPTKGGYDPGISVETWVDLLNDTEVFTESSLEIVKRLKDYGGQATCKQLAVKYGEDFNFYRNGATSLARRVAKKTGCPVMIRSENSTRWWTVLFVGRGAENTDEGSYIWRLRDELLEALDRVDLSNVRLYADNTPAIWKISHGSVSEENRIKLEKRNVAAMHSETRAIASSKIPQGESFMNSVKDGDYFYLCYGNSIRYLAQFVGNEAVPNPEIGNGWFEREYRVIAVSKDTSPYTGEKKWWTPDFNSTCVKVDDAPLFEKEILKPYFGMTLPELFENADEPHGYWWLTASPKIWSFADIGVGEEQSYTLVNENGNKRRIYQNFLDAQAGDIVIGYEANPVKKIVALARITKENDGEVLRFAKTEGLASPIDLQTIKSCPELEKMEFLTQQNGSLFKLTKGEFDFIMDLIREENPLRQADNEIARYTKEDFLSSVYMSSERYDVLEALLRNKKNVILQGAPGVGKTFTARRLAYAMMGEKDESRIELIQFHQNYSYEDFIQGYRPDGEGFKLTDGIFYRFCQRASNDPGRDYFFIIDEINRGNMSKIFGELLMLIEKDYRGTKATLAYSGMPFSVPKNLYLIGMMNTADRSLAMIDYALRRRFSFFEIEPGFTSEGFMSYQNSFGSETFNALIEKIRQLNKAIAEDSALGRGFRIGHSYFCGREPDGNENEWLHSVIEFDILPMLGEYWFDDPEKLSRWEKELNSVFDD
ncbi:MAG: EVE domain-containing protein [Clostridia bacterium]|nr:EVE domain-containing protein [Clostridia bacterium]